MYFPFMRGKRHELSALRKTAPYLSNQKVCAIIEPVKSNFNSLIKTVRELNSHSHTPLIIINPLEGEIKGTNIYSALIQENINFLPCIAFSHQNLVFATAIATQLINDNVHFATYFKDEPSANVTNITSAAYINSVRTTPNTSMQFLLGLTRLVKITDRFMASGRNADYPITPYNFTDDHLTFRQTPNTIGFGDFQIVGEAFSETGGPARAVALHLTYISRLHNDHMFIKHSVSTLDSGTTKNTANKFLQALTELINFANVTPDIDQSTVGFMELKDYHTRQHFPNLGPIKECSVIHHIQTLEKYL